MKGKWKVTCNPVGDRYLYAAYRLRDVNEVDHSGNREYGSQYMTSEAEAQKIADKLNSEVNA